MKPERYKLILRNKLTGELREALAKHAGMLSKLEANRCIKHARGRMQEPWEYIKERTQ